MSLSEELEENQNVVLKLESGYHKTGVLSVNKTIAKKFQSICYITTTKPSSAIAGELKNAGIDLQKYSFIDCVSKKAGLKKKVQRTVFVESPRSLTLLAIATSKMLKTEKPDLMLLDSISSLLVYNNELSVVKFLHFLMILIKGTKAKAVYIVMKSDMKRKVVREIELFADAITWLE